MLRDGSANFDVFDLHPYGDSYAVPAMIDTCRAQLAAHGCPQPIVASELFQMHRPDETPRLIAWQRMAFTQPKEPLPFDLSWPWPHNKAHVVDATGISVPATVTDGTVHVRIGATLDRCIRITAGTDADLDIFEAMLPEALRGSGRIERSSGCRDEIPAAKNSIPKSRRNLTRR